MDSWFIDKPEPFLVIGGVRGFDGDFVFPLLSAFEGCGFKTKLEYLELMILMPFYQATTLCISKYVINFIDTKLELASLMAFGSKILKILIIRLLLIANFICTIFTSNYIKMSTYNLQSANSRGQTDAATSDVTTATLHHYWT